MKKLGVVLGAVVIALGLAVPAVSATTTTAPRKFTAEFRSPKQAGVDPLVVQFYGLDSKWYTYHCPFVTGEATATSAGDATYTDTSKRRCTSRTSTVKRAIKVTMVFPAHQPPSLLVQINGFAPSPKTKYKFTCNLARLSNRETAAFSGMTLTSIGRCSRAAGLASRHCALLDAPGSTERRI